MIATELGNFAAMIEADLKSVAGVQSVAVDAEGEDVRVVACLSSFDRSVRREVYAKYSTFYREFPQYRFDFVTIDASDAGPQAASSEGRE